MTAGGTEEGRRGSCIKDFGGRTTRQAVQAITWFETAESPTTEKWRSHHGGTSLLLFRFYLFWTV